MKLLTLNEYDSADVEQIVRLISSGDAANLQLAYTFIESMNIDISSVMLELGLDVGDITLDELQKFIKNLSYATTYTIDKNNYVNKLLMLSYPKYEKINTIYPNTELNFRFSNFLELPIIAEPNKVSILGFDSCNRLSDISNLIKYENVTRLNIFHCKALEKLTGVDNIQHLHLFDMNNLSIEQVFSNSKINTLIIRTSKLKDLPKNISDAASTLQILQLSGNDLTNISNRIGSLKELVALNIQDNFIDSLPTALKGCTKLKKLSFTLRKNFELPYFLLEHPSIANMNIHINGFNNNPKHTSFIEDLTDRCSTLTSK